MDSHRGPLQQPVHVWAHQMVRSGIRVRVIKAIIQKSTVAVGQANPLMKKFVFKKLSDLW